jgi:hypothetical protein
MRNEADDPRGSAKINSTVHIRYHDLSNKEQHIKQKFTYSHILVTHFQYEKRNGAFWEEGICSAYD